jgi:hypothetical protein
MGFLKSREENLELVQLKELHFIPEYSSDFFRLSESFASVL